MEGISHRKKKGEAKFGRQERQVEKKALTEAGSKMGRKIKALSSDLWKERKPRKKISIIIVSQEGPSPDMVKLRERELPGAREQATNRHLSKNDLLNVRDAPTIIEAPMSGYSGKDVGSQLHTGVERN